MKKFNFKKTEHHQVSKFFDAVISEEKIRSILEQEDYDEDEIDELVIALSDDSHERYNEAYDIILDSDEIDDAWEWYSDDWWTDRKGGYEVEIDMECSDSNED